MFLLERLCVFVLVVIISSGVWANYVSAASGCATGELCNPLVGGMGLWKLIEYLISDILVKIIAPIVVTLMLLWSGFLFITAQGKEGKLAEARNNFFNVVLGAIILLGAYVIYAIVRGTINQIIG